MFIPINGHVEVEKVEQESPVYSSSNVYEQKGKVISLPFSSTSSPYTLLYGLKVGDIAYFDGWMTAEYPDKEGKMRCLVPFDAIRAYETDIPPVSNT